MKLIASLLICLLASSCATQRMIPGTNIPRKIFNAPTLTRETPLRTLTEIENHLGFLNQYLGSYPPRFEDARQREGIYQKWSDLHADIAAYYEANGDREDALFYYAEINRLGHNLDVAGSAQKADQTLSLMLKKYPISEKGNFCASYFYLSTSPVYFHKAGKSLITLKELYSPQLNDEVEAGLVYLHIMQRDKANALKQIDAYLTAFPEGSRKKEFLLFKEHLMNSGEIEQKNYN